MMKWHFPANVHTHTDVHIKETYMYLYLSIHTNEDLIDKLVNKSKENYEIESIYHQSNLYTFMRK